MMELSNKSAMSTCGGETSSAAANRDGGQYTKVLLTTMPTFDGKNVEGWIYKVKRYFRYHHVSDDERLVQATMSMEGEALDWLVWMDAENNLHSWQEFLDDLLKWFGNSPYDLLVGRLGRVVQTSSVSDYQHRLKF